MRSTQFAVVALMGAVLVLSSCRQESVAEKYHPAKIDSTDVAGIMRVTLNARAAERIGLQTAQIREDQVTLAGSTVTRKVMPYGALMYDTKGETWTFTNPQPLVFVREKVVVEDIDGDRVILAEGPAPGTVVVTVGAAELMGAEHKYGH
jgi:hypothetical protein